MILIIGYKLRSGAQAANICPFTGHIHTCFFHFINLRLAQD